MVLLILVLNKEEKLEEILTEFMRIGINGATVLSSTGMARVLTGSKRNEEDDIPLFGALRAWINPERAKSKTIFTVIPEGQCSMAVAAIESIIGDLSQVDCGIVFTVPIDYVKGLTKIEL